MLASIVINNHNYAGFVGAAIDSALAQTYTPLEVIVVDDGSTDGSQQILKSYGDRIQAVCKERGGQASALNVGIGRSRGEVVFVLDSDDVLFPDAVHCAMASFASDASVVWVQFRLEELDTDGNGTGIVKPPAYVPRRGGDLRRNILAFPFDILRMATSGNAFAARVLVQILPVPEDVYTPSGADWYLCPLVGIFGRTVFLEQVGGGYRLHGSNRAWFERRPHRLNLDGVRRDLRLMASTAAAIHRWAGAQGLRPPSQILSVSYIANRLISLRLDRARHPIKEDTVRGLVVLGVRAAVRRFDVRWPMIGLFSIWFALMALAPAPLAQRLAEWFTFSSMRRPFNPILGRLHQPAAPFGTTPQEPLLC